MANHILEATTISKPFGSGQKVVRIALRYGTGVDGASLRVDTYAVENRTVLNVFTASAPDAAAPETGGEYVILELDKKDPEASTVKSLHPRPSGGPRPGGGPPTHVHPSGRVRKGPSGLAKKREPLAVKVEQTAEIKAADGTVIDRSSVISTREINELSDKFRQFWHDGVEYNLYIPETCGPEKKYPMVLFIGDASIAGKEARITLEQGLGALCWVTDEMQREQPCYVLAPVHFDPEPITDDDYWCTERLDVIKDICDEVIEKYNIDPQRVYTTGQSMGCMSSFELMYRYPDRFAGALCVSGHWDREKIAACARRGQQLWFILSEADGHGYPCATDVKQILSDEGIKFGWYEWDGRLSPEELSALADQAASDGNTFRITVYPGESALRRGMEDECGNGHPAGWHLSYRVKGLCRWLLTNHLE